ncbi:MAG: hypothetical protein KDB98_01140 [Flavobacteriales bacterium]|nr:hypothetical protein [Flavobacteriales bacterium]
MNPILRNVLAVIAAVIAGGVANMGIIMMSGSLIPPPEGVNPADMESIKQNMHLFEPIHYVMPFLAHAMGSFVGALVAALLAATHKMRFAIGLGIWTLVGGIAAAFMIPAPTWFIVLDLSLAYIPTALIAGKLASGK